MFPGILFRFKTSLEGIKQSADYLIKSKLGIDNAELKNLFEID
jgi:hypothetical protein